MSLASVLRILADEEEAKSNSSSQLEKAAQICAMALRAGADLADMGLDPVSELRLLLLEGVNDLSPSDSSDRRDTLPSTPLVYLEDLEVSDED